MESGGPLLVFGTSLLRKPEDIHGRVGRTNLAQGEIGIRCVDGARPSSFPDDGNLVAQTIRSPEVARGNFRQNAPLEDVHVQRDDDPIDGTAAAQLLFRAAMENRMHDSGYILVELPAGERITACGD